MLEYIFDFVFGIIHDFMLASNRANDERRKLQESKIVESESLKNKKTKTKKKRPSKKRTV